MASVSSLLSLNIHVYSLTGQTKDIIFVLQSNNLDSMLVFTLAMALTALIMAWTIVVLAIKAWLSPSRAR